MFEIDIHIQQQLELTYDVFLKQKLEFQVMFDIDFHIQHKVYVIHSIMCTHVLTARQRASCERLLMGERRFSDAQ